MSPLKNVVSIIQYRLRNFGIHIYIIFIAVEIFIGCKIYRYVIATENIHVVSLNP